MCCWYKLDSNDDININFKNLFKIIIGLLVTKKKLAILI